MKKLYFIILFLLFAVHAQAIDVCNVPANKTVQYALYDKTGAAWIQATYTATGVTELPSPSDDGNSCYAVSTALTAGSKYTAYWKCTDCSPVSYAQEAIDSYQTYIDASITSRTKPADTQAAVTTCTTATTCTNLTNLPTMPTDWITAVGLKADAVTEIQNGLATPTNITAGTITTVTNLTNAPTNGDLTATMKASVNTEVDNALNTAIPALPTVDSINDRLDAKVSSRSTYAGGAVASVTGNVGGNVTGSVGSVVAGVTVTTNNDKTGYTASTVSDKTGYSLTQAFPTNFSSLLIEAVTGKVTSTNAGTGASLVEIEGSAVLAKEATLNLMKGATFDTSTDSLEAIRNRGDAAWVTGAAAAGTWQITTTVYVTATTTPIADYEISVFDSTNTVHQFNVVTGPSGTVTLNLDTGTYKLRGRKTGYSPANPTETLIVSADGTVTYYATAYVIPAPASPDDCVVYEVVTNQDAATYPTTVKATAQIVNLPYNYQGRIVSGAVINGTYDNTTGIVQWTVPKGAKLDVIIPIYGYDKTKIVPSSCPLGSVRWSDVP